MNKEGRESKLRIGGEITHKAEIINYYAPFLIPLKVSFLTPLTVRLPISTTVLYYCCSPHTVRFLL